MLAQTPDLFIEPWLHAYYFMAGWMAAAGQPLPQRQCAATAHVFAHMPVRTHPDDLLAGEHGLTNFFPLVCFGGAGAHHADDIRASSLLPRQQEELIGWLQAEPFAWRNAAPVAGEPEELQRLQENGTVAVWGSDLNHSIRDYGKVLRLGFAGIRAEVDTALAQLDITAPDAAVRRATLLGWQHLCDAAMALGTRHADVLRAQAEAATDPAQRRELNALADICACVPAQPARSFHEAVQALWFAHILTCYEDGINANGLGRIDQFLWPYLKADLAAGHTTWEAAADLLAALWTKLYLTYDVQQMMVGGQTPEGADATNPLSYLALDVTEGLGFIRCLSARLHGGTPRTFVARCLDLIAHGGGIPFFFNDDAIIPALVDGGIPLGDARDYAAIGCIEITIPGKANPHAVSHWLNLAKCLELALNDGRDLRDGMQIGPATGTLAEHVDMNAVLAAYTQQVDYALQWAVYGSNAAEQRHRWEYRLPYHSLLTADCIANGHDIIEGGARYNYHSSAAMGIPNVADSLAALAQAVYASDTVSAADLLQALRDDFASCEELRLYLRHKLPKYGNDEPLPDGYAADLSRQYCEGLARFTTPSGGRYFAHLFTYTLMLPYGALTGASPDGRHAGEPLAYSVSPAQGRDHSGLTALLSSLSRLPHHLVAASSSAIIEVDPTLFTGAGREAMVDLLITAIAQGIGQLQINVVDADTLRAAQAAPERYRNLSVRVSGFSQQFCLLEHEMQEHIIARTKHTC